MSYTFFYISKNKLDQTFFNNLHENGYSAEDFTAGVKDRKSGFNYYNVEPFVIYLERFSKILDIDYREMGVAEYIQFFASALYKSDGFYFIFCNYDNTDIEKGYLHSYFEKCVKEEIAIEEFNKKTLDAQNLFEVGIAYLVKPT